MDPINLSLMILTYNFVIGVLLMLASEKIGAYAGYFVFALYKEKASRLMRIAVFTFGASVAALTAGIYLYYLATV